MSRVDWSVLRGRRIVVWPDRDEVGEKAAKIICTHLVEARVITPPPWKPKGWDLADAEHEGVKSEKLIQYILSQVGKLCL